MMGDDERAIEVARESLQLAEALGFEAARSRNLNTIGVAKVMMRRPQRLAGPGAGGRDRRGRTLTRGGQRVGEPSTMMTVLGDLSRAARFRSRPSRWRGGGLVAFVRWQRPSAHCLVLDGPLGRRPSLSRMS